MTIAYWIVGGVLALMYLYAGGLKLIRSKDQLRPMMGWVDTFPLAFIRALGAAEVLGVAGLILPPVTGVAVVLARVAAVCLAAVQVGAIVLHLKRGEGRLIGLNIALAILAVVEVWLAGVWL